jgi:hypothetical protein
MSWQIFLFALPEEFEKIHGNFEEAAKSFKRKVGKCKMWYGSHFVCQFSSNVRACSVSPKGDVLTSFLYQHIVPWVMW